MESLLTSSRKRFNQKIAEDKYANRNQIDEQQNLSNLLNEIEDFSIKLDNSENSKSSEGNTSASRSRNEMSERSGRSRERERHGHDDRSRSRHHERSKSRHRRPSSPGERDKSRTRRDVTERSKTLGRYERERRREERDKDRDRDRDRSRTIDRDRSKIPERDRSRTIDRERSNHERDKSRTGERDKSRTLERDRERERRREERDRDRDADKSKTLDRERVRRDRGERTHNRKMSSPADISILKSKNANPPPLPNTSSNAENSSIIKDYNHSIATFPRNASLSKIKTDQLSKNDNKIPFSPGVSSNNDNSINFPKRKDDPYSALPSPLSAGQVPVTPREEESHFSSESSTTAVMQENKPIFPTRSESRGVTRMKSRNNTENSEIKKDGNTSLSNMSISEMKSALLKDPKKLGGPMSILAALKIGEDAHMYKNEDTLNPSFNIQKDKLLMKDLLENVYTLSSNCYILNKDTFNVITEKIKKYTDQIASLKLKIQSESSIQESVINIVKNGAKDSQTQKTAKEKLSSTNRKLDKLAADLFKVSDKLRITQNDYFSHIVGVYNWEIDRIRQTGGDLSLKNEDIIRRLKHELEDNVYIVKEQKDELDASKALVLQLQAQLELKKLDSTDTSNMSTLDRAHVDELRQQIKELEKQRKEIKTLENKFNENSSAPSPNTSWMNSLSRQRNMKRLRELEDENTELKDQASEQNDTIDKLKAENSDLKAKLTSIEILYQTLPSSITTNRHFTVEDFEKTVKLLLEDNEEQFKRIKDMNTEFQDLKKKLREAEADNEMQQKRMNKMEKQTLQNLKSPISPRSASLKKMGGSGDSDTLKMEVINLKKEIFDQNNEISRLERDLKVAEGQNNDMKNDLNESKSREEKYKKENNDLEAEIRKVEDNYMKAQREVEDQKQKIETLKNHVSELEREVNNKKMKERDASDELYSKRQELMDTAEDLNTLREENQSLKQKLKNISSEQNQLSRDASKNTLELGELRTKYNKVQEEYEQLNSRYESIKKELEDVKYELESEESKSKKLRENNNALQEKYDTLLIEKQQQERGNNFDKKKQNDQLADAENRIVSVKRELNKVQEELSEKNAQLRKADDYEKKLLQELEDVKMDYKYLKDEHTSMSDAHSKLLDEQMSLKRELEDMKNERDEFEDKCKRRYKNEIRDLQHALQDAEDEIEQQNLRVREFQTKYDNEINNSKDVRDELDRVKQNLASAKNLMNDTLSNKDKEVEEAIRKAKDAESKSEDAQLKVQNMEKLVEDMQGQLNNAESALVDFKSKSFQEREQFQEKIETLNQKLQDSDEKARGLERDLKESRKKGSEQEEELAHANKEIERIIEQHEKDMKSLTQSYQNMIDDLEEKLSEAETLRDKLDDLDFKYQNDCEKWDRSKRDYEKEILDLTDEQTRTQKQIDELHKELMEARQRDTGATFDEVQNLKDREQTLTEELKKREAREARLETEMEATLKEFERLTMNIADFEGEKMKMNKINKEQKEEIEDLRKKLQEATVDNLGSKVSPNASARTKEQTMRNEFRKMLQEVREDYQKQLKKESERNDELDQTIKQMKREKDMMAYHTCNIGTQTIIY
jgi:chromosome segregation ATPase